MRREVPPATSGPAARPHPARRGPARTAAVRGAGVLGLALLAVLLLGCRHPYSVEGRDLPVHVLLLTPHLQATGGAFEATMYVDADRVVAGRVDVPAGAPGVELATAYVQAGTVRVSAVFGGGTAVASDEVQVRAESWLVVTYDGRQVSMRISCDQPPLRCAPCGLGGGSLSVPRPHPDGSLYERREPWPQGGVR